MSNLHRSRPEPEPAPDPYADPVSYLAALGIEAELVEVIDPLPEAA